MLLKRKIIDQALNLGFDACHFTSAEPPTTGNFFQDWLKEGAFAAMDWIARPRSVQCRLDPQKLLPGAKTFICLASSYYTGEETTQQKNFARYARLPDYHETLRAPLEQLSEFIRCLASPPPQSLFFTDSGPVLERDLAQRAGLGFIGKHNNLIHPKLGNWFFLAEILTTLELEPDTPSPQQCGSCSRCLEACPTGALSRPWHLDARKCLSYLTIEHRGEISEPFQKAMGERFFGCDRCLEVCPWNHTLSSPALKPLKTDTLPLSASQIAAMDESSFKKVFSGTAFLRAKRKGLLRNLLIAEKNRTSSQPLP